MAYTGPFNLALFTTAAFTTWATVTILCMVDSPERYNIHVAAGLVLGWYVYSNNIRVPVVSDVSNAVLPGGNQAA